MVTFVLVHGAWHGGGCWWKVAPLLRAASCAVYTPTPTGLAERVGELDEGMDLDAHIDDVVGLLEGEDLASVVLVGHSYGGMVITGVADRRSLGQPEGATPISAGMLALRADREVPEQFRDALDWLNAIGPQEVSCFGIAIEILEINGQRAPNFKAVAQPNTWGARSLPTSAVGERAPSDRRLAFQAFYAALLEALKAHSPGITAASRAQPESWFIFGSGRSGVAFGWAFLPKERFRVEVYIDTSDRERNVAIFEALRREREAIEGTIGEPLDWQLLEGRRATRIALRAPHPATIEDAPEELVRLREWAVAATVRTVGAFRPRLKALAK